MKRNNLDQRTCPSFVRPLTRDLINRLSSLNSCPASVADNLNQGKHVALRFPDTIQSKRDPHVVLTETKPARHHANNGVGRA
jgi:hypothetical protein